MIIGIIGAGTMGQGIATVFAENDHIIKLSATSVNSVLNKIELLHKKFLKLQSKGLLTKEQSEKIMNKIEACTIDDLYDCDLIIETVNEDIKTKIEILNKVLSICKGQCVVATNTSSISITLISSYLKHPIVGMHFFNPAPSMQLVEVIKGLTTSDSDVEFISNLAKSVNKVPIIVKDNSCFIVNRILIPMINEAIFVYSEGGTSANDIDTAMKLGTNQPMGPLELADYIGLDVCLSIMNSLYDEKKEDKYRPCPLLKKMVYAKWLGRKTKKGFYDYS